MYYRIIILLLFIFTIFAYADTRSIKQYFDDIKLSREYQGVTKVIGIGIKNNKGQAEVKDVLLNTPAALAGVEAGDVLLDINGNTVESAETVKDYLQYVKKGEKIALKIKKPDNTVIKVELMPAVINDFEQIYTK